MYQIVGKKALNPTVTQMEILAPFVAKKALPGQFIILRVDEDGERIPLTIAGYDREKGTVTIIFQIVGATTKMPNSLEIGDYVTIEREYDIINKVFFENDLLKTIKLVTMNKIDKLIDSKTLQIGEILWTEDLNN